MLSDDTVAGLGSSPLLPSQQTGGGAVQTNSVDSHRIRVRRHCLFHCLSIRKGLFVTVLALVLLCIHGHCRCGIFDGALWCIGQGVWEKRDFETPHAVSWRSDGYT